MCKYTVLRTKPATDATLASFSRPFVQFIPLYALEASLTPSHVVALRSPRAAYHDNNRERKLYTIPVAVCFGYTYIIARRSDASWLHPLINAYHHRHKLSYWVCRFKIYLHMKVAVSFFQNAWYFTKLTTGSNIFCLNPEIVWTTLRIMASRRSCFASSVTW